MSLLRTIFWNAAEKRFRAGWRLLIQILLIIIAGIPVGLFATVAGIQNVDNVLISQGLQGLAGIFVVVVSIYIAGRFIDKRSFADFGQKLSARWWRELGFGLALGAGLMLAIFLVELALGWITIEGFFATRGLDYPFGLAILGPTLLFLAVGYYEELFSRGYQLTNMAEGLRFLKLGNSSALLIATLLSSAVFGVLHAGNPNASLISTINITLAGIFLALGYLLTKNIAIPIGLHITWNFFQGNVFGFPVSGTNAGPTFIDVTQGGPDLWTGGQFGPEAGIIGIIAMVTGSVLIWLYAKRHYEDGNIKADIADYPIAEGTALG